MPGAAVESHGVWVARLLALARSLEAVALAALLLVAGIAAAVVAVAVRAGIAARRAAIAILHALGASDGDIAGRFAQRVALLVGARRARRHAGGGAGAGRLRRHWRRRCWAGRPAASLWDTALAQPALGGSGAAADPAAALMAG